MNTFFAADDYPIDVVPATPLWSENYAFSCFDPKQDIALIGLLGRWWEDPLTWRELISVSLPGDRLLCVKNHGRAATATVASAAMLRVEVVTPGKTLRLLYDGPAWESARGNLVQHGLRNGAARRLRLQLDFEALSPVWNMSGHAERGVDIAGALHIEQVGAGSGFVEYGQQRYEISAAFMNRDHSRGVRDLTRFHRHCWAQGWFADEQVSFNLYAIELFGIDGLAMSKASVSKGDHRYPAEVIDVEMIRGTQDARQSYRIVLNSELGVMRLQSRPTRSSLPIAFTHPWEVYHGITPGVHCALTFEEAVLWDWEGRKGLGWSERAYNAAPFAGPAG